ncbi:phospholipase A2 inhibitor and Ly6/PLAUR domain-containing protein-like isoform X1 [Stegostoma tigrinum]|uniref:phospholipase A2 inhibitor and Ly6/PLAUR domain-containing protein-like isoform X1 n=1 Tax=Stegostoma tigrinum TaxID=3053191 RepID=UPI00287076F2|nr:phospholipase A2 inhibitor and Ly6/PLAUR domain-containing protein-like isoform X1 [Stegostoma tigrinum]
MLQRSQTMLSPTVLLCSLLAEVWPLTCHQCSSISGGCDQQQVTCLSGINTCLTKSISIILAGKPNQVIRNSCGSCSDPVSLNTGSVILSESSRCCDFNLCNDQTVVEARNSTPNGLECRGCFNNSRESCSLSEQTVQCAGSETRCVNVSGIEALASAGGQFFARGCASETVCQSAGRLSEFRIQFDGSPKCCSVDLCNGDVGGGASTRKPAVTLSSPVTSVTRGRETTAGKAVTLSSPVTSVTRGRETTAGKGCVIGVTVAVVAGVLILLLICYFHCRKKHDSGPV